MRHDPRQLEPIYEFQVVPAPRKGERVQGLRTDDARMAYTWTELLNDMALDGWDYVRADTIPNDNSADLTGTAPKTMTLLVFRRLLVVLDPDRDARFS
ncbi:hypothetical protein JANAI62_10190 [Jannaschia pagri]|uniref:DUF4177 domain-containing protein n=1 Tax=Jannaschia pagri TaxID=2829797 RepID=A0ABQ4NJ99_9RHOB|nr:MULTISPECIES: hypothetical protein [unclassified Jannaschia]GIT90564.1 hypothetical protein JANAI61_10220 [Jannaschia sp. AI_61]GIT94396.1 hypothetical protein JANAI62_10190 [Jannaschia sp. AI_62]